MKGANTYFRDDRKKSVEKKMLKIQNREWINQQFKVSGKSLRPISLMVPGEKGKYCHRFRKIQEFTGRKLSKLHLWLLWEIEGKDLDLRKGKSMIFFLTTKEFCER